MFPHTREVVIDEFRRRYKRAIYQKKPWRSAHPATAFKAVAAQVMQGMVAEDGSEWLRTVLEGYVGGVTQEELFEPACEGVLRDHA